MEPLLSVIVPIYRVEPYLRQCVDSILGQTYRNLEVILVDDGSPDNCGAICDAYAAQDSRVRVIHKPNGGLSDARNAGLAAMTGDYVTFVDSDDWLDPNALSLLLQPALKYNADLVIGNHDRIEDETYRLLWAPIETGSETVLNRHEAMLHFFQNGCASWARLYKADVHRHTLFPADEINEDEAIVLRILDHCQIVATIPPVVYHYRCRPESITTVPFHRKKLVWAKHCRDNLAFVQAHYPELEADAAARYRGSLLWLLTEMALSDDDYQAETAALLAELRVNRRLFRNAPYTYPQDRLRMLLLLHFPFGVYRKLIRIKRT